MQAPLPTEIEAKDVSLETSMRYVAFCDVLGFSNAVVDQFDATISVYRDFMVRMRDWPFPNKAEVSIYSDSILIVSDDLPAVIYAVKNLWFATLSQDWLIRGGIAYGRYWECRENGNLFVVSDALVRAVKLESTISVPAVGFCPEVDLTLSPWVTRFEHGLLQAPVLHFSDLSFVNPFNPFWFQSARTRVRQILSANPAHKVKYDWFLDLAEAVDQNKALVPVHVWDELIRTGILKWTPDESDPIESNS